MYPVMEVSSDLFISTYFLVISVAYSIGLFWVSTRSVYFGIDKKNALDVSLVIMVGGFLGSRIFHIVWEHPGYYMSNPWNMFKIWQGGFVFYGGLLGALAPAYWMIKIHYKQSLQSWMALFAPVIPLVYSLGRFATFLSGSGYGKPTDLPWGVVFPPGTEAPSGVALHPTQLYAGFWELLVFGVILVLQKRYHFLHRAMYVLMVLHGLGRLFMEQFRDDFRGGDIIGLSISSWLSLCLIALGVFFFLRDKNDRK